MNEVAETVCHGAMEGGSSVFSCQGNDSICECAPWGCESSLVMIFFPDLNLVVSEKTIHEGKDLMYSACINDLINEGCWEVVFGTFPIQITKVYTNANGTLFFIQGNMI